MNSAKRLGCLTGTGFIAAIITLLALAGFAFTSGSQMFSSGALNAQPGKSLGGVTSHAEIKECKACHTAPWEAATMADRCLECHTDIDSQMRDVAQLHGSIAQKSPNAACRDCHKDHRGPTASLTDLGENAFPHETFGFSLIKHQQTRSGAPITCKDCHGDDITTFVPDSCQTCHSDMDLAFTQNHIIAYGADCMACHDGVDRFDNFNHSVYAFKLAGGHANVACTECHLDARSMADLQSAPQDCYSCHQQDDKHGGEYGKQCETCHDPSAWKNATFDHARFASSSTCVNCHAEPQSHAGQFGTDCAACHSTTTWENATFDHARFASSSACVNCHAEPQSHAGQFGTDCAACHSTTTWENATFDHARFASSSACVNCHAEPQSHAGQFGTDCAACHSTTTWKNATFDHARFASSSTCVNCHAEPQSHAGQFGTDCAACHLTTAWTPASYNGTHTFPIYHGDGNGSCQTCHPNSLTTYTCYGCHEHTETKIASKHIKEGIPNFQNCMECHSDGSKHKDGGHDDDDD